MFIMAERSNYTQRDTYFLITSLFWSNNQLRGLNKIGGVYSVHKNNKCLYVGQSSNLASRLATHITGSYSQADIISIHTICLDGHGFDDFNDRCLESKKSILLNNEDFFIRLLKPVDNIIVDNDKNTDYQKVSSRAKDWEEEVANGCHILSSDFTITLDSEDYMSLESSEAPLEFSKSQAVSSFRDYIEYIVRSDYNEQ